MPPSPTTTPTRRFPRNERISKIVAVTRKLLEEVGYNNIVTNEVAARCGISEATIYKYFDSKRDLLIKVAEEWYRELLSENYRSFAGMSALEALRHVIWRHFSIVKRDPALSKFMLLDLRPDPEYRNMPIYQLNRKLLAQVTVVIKTYMESGDLRSDVPVSLVRDMIFGCIEHQTWAYLRNEGDFLIDEATEGMVKIIYEGLRTKGAKADYNPGEKFTETVNQLESITQRLEKAVKKK